MRAGMPTRALEKGGCCTRGICRLRHGAALQYCPWISSISAYLPTLLFLMADEHEDTER